MGSEDGEGQEVALNVQMNIIIRMCSKPGVAFRVL